MDSYKDLSSSLTENFYSYMKKYNSLYQTLTERSIQYLSINDKPFIIDLGSGPGFLTLNLQQKLPNAIIIGLEPSGEMLRSIPRDLIHKDTYFMQAQAENIPITSSSVDMIISRYSIPYWDNINLALSEIYRILKPGGHVIFEALNKSYPFWKLKLISISMHLKKAPKNVIAYHIDAYNQCYTYDQLKKLLTDHHFLIKYEEYKKTQWRFLIVGEKPQD